MLAKISSILQIAGTLLGLALIIYNVILGVTIQEIGIPGVISVAFGSKNREPAPATRPAQAVVQPGQGVAQAAPPAIDPAPARASSGSTSAVGLQALTLDIPTASFASPAQARVTLSGPAPFPAARITLRSSDATVATVPDFTIVMAGDTSSTFRITAYSSGPPVKPQAKSQQVTATIIASYLGQEQRATVTVLR